MSEKTVQYVTWGTFLAAMSLFVAAIGWLFLVNASVAAKVDSYSDKEDKTQSSLSSIQASVSKIETNIDWLKESKRK